MLFECLSRYSLIQPIGKGAYGKVLLVKKKEKDPTKQADGELYAMKVLKKSEILRRNQVEHTMTERRILVSIRSINVNNRAL